MSSVVADELRLRIRPIHAADADGRAKELLDELGARGREPGPMVRAMANAPALLRGYLDLNRAMKRGHLDRRVTERIAIAARVVATADRRLQSRRRRSPRGNHRVSTPYLAWAVAVGAAGCGRCAAAA